MVDIAKRDAGLTKTVVDRVVRKLPDGKGHGPLPVLDVREAFFLRSGYHVAIAHQRRRTVVEGSIDAERDHSAAPAATNLASGS